MNTYRLTVHVKTDDIYENVAEYFEKRFDTYFELDRSLPKEKNEKVIELMKIELCGQIMKKNCWIKTKNI